MLTSALAEHHLECFSVDVILKVHQNLLKITSRLFMSHIFDNFENADSEIEMGDLSWGVGEVPLQVLV